MYSEYYSEQKQFHRLIVDYLNVNMASKGKKRGKAIIDDKVSFFYNIYFFYYAWYLKNPESYQWKL